MTSDDEMVVQERMVDGEVTRWVRLDDVATLMEAAELMVRRADDDAPREFWLSAVEALREALEPFQKK